MPCSCRRCRPGSVLRWQNSTTVLRCAPIESPSRSVMTAIVPRTPSRMPLSRCGPSRATYEPARGPVVGWAMAIVRHRAIRLARYRSADAGRDEGAARLDDQSARDDVPTDFAARAEREQLTELL